MRLNEEGQVLLGDPGVDGCRDRLKEFEFNDETGVPGALKPEPRSSDSKLKSKDLKSSSIGLIKEHLSVSKHNPEKSHQKPVHGSLQAQGTQPKAFVSSALPSNVYGATRTVQANPPPGSQYTDKSSHRNWSQPTPKQNTQNRDNCHSAHEKPRLENAYLASSGSHPTQPRVSYSSVPGDQRNLTYKVGSSGLSHLDKIPGLSQVHIKEEKVLGSGLLRGETQVNSYVRDESSCQSKQGATEERGIKREHSPSRSNPEYQAKKEGGVTETNPVPTFSFSTGLRRTNREVILFYSMYLMIHTWFQCVLDDTPLVSVHLMIHPWFQCALDDTPLVSVCT